MLTLVILLSFFYKNKLVEVQLSLSEKALIFCFEPKCVCQCFIVYMPSPNRLVQYLRIDPKMHSPELGARYIQQLMYNQLVLPQVDNNVILYEIREYSPLLDSSNVTTNHWIKIAEDIEQNYEAFNGFVVLHGTDTMAYTSSVLSFIFDGLKKPVIVTGAQISIYEVRTDAFDNIAASLILAGCYDIPEVCIFFCNKLMRGNRTTKVSPSNLNAFDSFNYPYLATTHTQIKVHENNIMRRDGFDFIARTNLNQNVAFVKFTPTLTYEMLQGFLLPSVEGLVIQTFGAGNIPSDQTQLIDTLRNAVQREVLIVNITQCIEGTVSPTYEAGEVLYDIGVISGYDMTSEAAVTKMCFVLGFSDLSYSQKVELMTQNIRGELTNDN